MADLKKLAMGRKGYTPTEKGKPDAKPAKKLEESCKEEIGELEAAFRERLAKEDRRKAAVNDAETWICIYFRSRAEKEAFLREHGLNRIGDKYLDGRAADRALKGRGAIRFRDSHRNRGRDRDRDRD